ncbi:cAMP-regulated phosphoprotein family protein [Pseudohyphozyma bogoriensis]|nr:cAMP-regulated phosphoprotein family protein [Pseudohyphozyma bogoriensis]
MLPGRQKVDISSFTEQERELFQKYGKVPTHKNLLSQKLKERKYFDSGDYAMSKAGVTPHQQVGTAIPSPADIPHASPPANPLSTSPSSSGISVPGMGSSPTNTPQNSFGAGGPGVGLGTSPGKEPIGTERQGTLA